MTWQPVTYDPELNLLYVTTGNPQPVIAFRNREGANLFTASIVALNPETGKMVWYFQSSPNDTHDWDATQTAVLIDDVVDGRPRKLLAQASRNGHFFSSTARTERPSSRPTMRRPTGRKATTRKASRFPIRRRSRRWMASSSRLTRAARRTGPRRASARRPDSSTSPRRARSASSISTIPARTRRGGAARIAAAGRSRCCRRSTTRPARSAGRTAGTPTRTRACSPRPATCCSQAATHQDLVALNATTGDAIWHARLGNSVSNGPITYDMDGRQYVIVGAGDSLFAFVMNNER